MYTRKIVSGFLVFLVAFSATGSVFAATPTPPDGFPSGGLFARYFTNMIQEGAVGFDGICNNGGVIIGFNTGSSSSYGLPVCKTLSELGGSVGGATQWTTSGTTIYYTSGNVGIGTSAPSAKLEIQGGDIRVGGSTIGNGGGSISSNIAFGPSNLFNNTSGWNTVAIGNGALMQNTTGYQNTAIGGGSLVSNTTGYQNTAIGASTLSYNTVGFWNTALGYQSLYSNTSGYNNSAIGQNTLYYNTTGYGNTAVGNFSLNYNTIGNRNTALGKDALSNNTTGSDNIAIGYQVQVPSTTASNQLNIGNWIYGSNGNIGIGVSAPTAKLEVAGQVKITGGAPGAGKVLTSDASGLASWQSASSQWTTNGSDIGYTSGNVGIGSTTPSAKLDVNGEVKSTFTYVQKTGAYSDGAGSTAFNKWLRVLSTGNPYSGISYGELLIVAKGRADGFARVVFSCSGYGNCDISVPENTIPMTSSLTDTSGGLQGVRIVYDSSSFSNPAYLDIEIRNDGGYGNTTYTAYLVRGGNMTLSSTLTDATTSTPVANYIDLRTATNSVAHAFSKGKILFMNNGKMQITDGTQGAGKVLTSDASGLASWQTVSGGGSSQWGTVGSNIAYTGGNIGVGTSSITAKLDVKGGSFQIIDSTNFDAGKTAIIRGYGNFYSNGSAVTSSVFDAILDNEVGGGSEGAQAIRGVANCMGNINGHCGSLYGGHFILNDKSPNNTNDRYLYDGAAIFAEYTNNSPEPGRTAWYSSLSAGKFIFKNLTSVTIPEKAIGIQVATPVNSVGGVINNYYGVYVDNVNVSGITNKYAFYYNGSSPFVVTGNGDMGVGTTTPSYKLHVNGTAGGTSWTNTSDIRLKKDIQILPVSSLTSLSLIRPVSFDWKNPKDEYMKQRQYGFIAQEVEKIYPNLVSTANDEMKTKSVNYDGFIPLLVSSIQELKKENDTLKNENTLLKSRLDVIEKKLGM